MNATEMVMFACLFLIAVFAIAHYVETRREARRRRKAEEDAGRFLVEQVAHAPAGATVILGAGTYRLPDTVRISRDRTSLLGAPENASRLLMERDVPIIHVRPEEGVPMLDGCEIAGLHLEHRGPGDDGIGLLIEDTEEPRAHMNAVH